MLIFEHQQLIIKLGRIVILIMLVIINVVVDIQEMIVVLSLYYLMKATLVIIELKPLLCEKKIIKNIGFVLAQT